MRSWKNQHGIAVWGVVGKNNLLQSNEKGMSLLELADYAGIETEGLQ